MARCRAERGAVGQGGRQKLLRTARVRTGTTVVGANVAYPTDSDSGLLAKAAGKLARAARWLQAAGASGTVITDRQRSHPQRDDRLPSMDHDRPRFHC